MNCDNEVDHDLELRIPNRFLNSFFRFKGRLHSLLYFILRRKFLQNVAD